MKTVISQISSRKDFFKGKGLVEAKCAWLSFGAIMALEHILKPGMRVMELGSGGSTLFFADRTDEVESFETDRIWFELMKVAINDYKNIRLRIGDEQGIITMVEDEPDNFYHVVLIDTGKTIQHTPNRKLLAETAIPKLKKGGYLIIDNYEKYGNKDFDYSKFDVYTFDDFGYSGRGTRILVKK